MSDVNPNPLPLVFEQPKGRGKPPRHLADLDLDDRKEAVEALGVPAYRASRSSTHYFTRLECPTRRR